MSKKSLLLVLVAYVSSAAVAFAAFRMLGSKPSVPSQGENPTATQEQTPEELAGTQLLNVDPAEPKDQECPLNGQKFTATEKNAWSTKRPLAVMIENHPDARPQSGLSKADVVFEALAEAGVTRFMSVFYCAAQQQDVKIAPVRSARTYFIDWASSFNRPIYTHVGGANLAGPANALGQLRDYDWHLRNDVDAMSVGYPTFVRDYSRLEGKDLATEHTMVSSTDKLWQIATKRGWTNVTPVLTTGKKATTPQDWLAGFTPWKFQDGGKGTGDSATKISYLFRPEGKDYAVEWSYDSASNSYKRNLAGTPHVDLNNNEQVAVKNVVVLITDEKGPIDEKSHLLYTTIGTGNAYLFQNGTVQKVTWSKKDRVSPLVFKNGTKDVEFVRGPIWISVLGKKMSVTY